MRPFAKVTKSITFHLFYSVTFLVQKRLLEKKFAEVRRFFSASQAALTNPFKGLGPSGRHRPSAFKCTPNFHISTSLVFEPQAFPWKHRFRHFLIICVPLPLLGHSAREGSFGPNGRFLCHFWPFRHLVRPDGPNGRFWNHFWPFRHLGRPDGSKWLLLVPF